MSPMIGQNGYGTCPLVDLGHAYRVVYAVQLADELWILHAFQKKSRRGIKTPEHEVDLVRDRLKKLKEMLR